MARPLPNDCRRLFFDLETGGLFHWQHDMVEVAAILTDPSGEIVLEEFSTRVFPERPVDAKAAEINGYNQEKWATTAVPIEKAADTQPITPGDADAPSPADPLAVMKAAQGKPISAIYNRPA